MLWAEKVEKMKQFLIICEGENTEPEYFKSFPVGNAEVESYGLGMSKTALVNAALKKLKNDEDAKRKEVWVVFDMDIKGDQSGQLKEDYNNAIELATRNKLRVAYSNDAFELWFLLHYQYFDSQITRHEYYEKLSTLWNCNYEKVGKQIEFSRKIYQQLENDERVSQLEAFARAERLLNDQIDMVFSDQNPCTTVFQLVEELNKYL